MLSIKFTYDTIFRRQNFLYHDARAAEEKLSFSVPSAPFLFVQNA